MRGTSGSRAEDSFDSRNRVFSSRRRFRSLQLFNPELMVY